MTKDSFSANWTPQLEESYTRHNRSELFEAYKMCALLGAGLFPAGIFLDVITQPNHIIELTLLRLGATLVFFLHYIGARKNIYPSKNAVIAGRWPIATSSIFITAMCLVLDGYQSPYYAGINLVTLAAGLIFPWGARNMAVAVAMIFGIYISAVLVQAGFRIERFDILFNNLYFMFCTATITTGSAWLSDRLRKQAFYRLYTTEQAQAKLKEYDELKTQFFANVSHELRTPLTLILGPAQKLLRERENDAELKHDIESISRNARLLLRHVNDLLDVAKVEAKKLDIKYTEADCAETLRRITSQFEILARERDIIFEIFAPPHLNAQFDVEKMERVFMNLLSNAFKFTPEGGLIRCSLGLAVDGQIKFVIKDSGPGIPAHLRERVFERFFQGEDSSTRRYGGTGLGLAIVKDFLELHRGTIAIDSATEEGGARISLRFPMLAPAGTVLQNQLFSPAHQLAGYSDLPAYSAPRSHPEEEENQTLPLVLLVEDNLEMLSFIQGILKEKFRVALATNAREALKIMESIRPDLILTDMMMPEMSGEELVTRIRQNSDYANTPVIMITAKADDDLRINILRSGAQDFVLKPFSAEELLARVENFVGTKRARDLLQKEVSTRQSDIEGLAFELVKGKKELQESLEKTETARQDASRSLQLREEFMSIASHELKTPLTALKLQFQILKRKYVTLAETDTSAKELLRVANYSDRQLDRLVRLIEDMLDISKISSGKLLLRREEVDLQELVHDVIERLSEQISSSGSLVNVEHGEKILGHWDSFRIEQALINLVINAVKYGSAKAISIRTRLQGNRAIVEVEDHGMGIDEKDLERIFNRFERAVHRNISGLGLGLYITRQIVEAHGGRVMVRSKLGEGSTFSIELPLLDTIHEVPTLATP